MAWRQPRVVWLAVMSVSPRASGVCTVRLPACPACLSTGVGAERASRTIYPPAQQTFSAFNLSPLPDIKVVILGQDPYHGPGAVARGGATAMPSCCCYDDCTRRPAEY
jgi:hypothetical protein